MSIRRLSALLAFAALAATTGAAHATVGTLGALPFSAVYVFGDSLSDGGNNNLTFFNLTGPNPTGPTFIPSLPYAPSAGFTNRPTYSNGPVWFNSFTAGLGMATFAAPSLLGGGNYAYGGARMSVDGAGAPPFAGPPFPASLQTQLNGHLSTTPVSPTALYVIAGGGNDVRAVGEAVAANPANIVALTSAGATAFATSAATMVSTLRGAGATNIVVWNVPDVGKSPASGSGVGPVAGAASFIAGSFNSALSTALAGSGAQIFDLYGLVGSYIANPGAYGFTNVTQACGFAGNGCDASTALFWDGIHPTAYAQSLVAGAMLTQVPEPASVWMFMAGLLAFGAIVRRRRA